MNALIYIYIYMYFKIVVCFFHINMNMIIGICRSFNVNISIRIIHCRIRLNRSDNAGINTGIILKIQQIINVSISLGDSMTDNFVAASILMQILLLVYIL